MIRVRSPDVGSLVTTFCQRACVRACDSTSQAFMSTSGVVESERTCTPEALYIFVMGLIRSNQPVLSCMIHASVDPPSSQICMSVSN